MSKLLHFHDNLPTKYVLSNHQLSNNSLRNLDFVLSHIRDLNVLAPDSEKSIYMITALWGFDAASNTKNYPKINFFHRRFALTVTNEYHSNICAAHKLRWHCRLIFQYIYAVGTSHHLLVGFYWIHQEPFQWLI